MGLALAAPTAHALTAQEVFRRAGEVVWELETLDHKGARSGASSALVLQPGRAIVQCDVLEGAAALRLTKDGRTLDAERAGAGDRNGWCLLVVPGLAAPPPVVGQAEPDAGARVFAVGNALGLGLGISEGVVSAMRSARGESFIQFTAAIAPGSEGGGLFDAEGRLLGVITYRVRDGQNVNFAVPVRRFHDLEARINAAGEAERLRATAERLFRDANWAELGRHAQTWRAADEDNPEPWLWLGYAAQNNNDWPEAERAFRAVLEREPSAIHAGISLSVALLQQGKAQAAADAARALLAVRQEDTRIWTAIGIAELALERRAEAKAAFQRAVQLDRWNQIALGRLAYLAHLEGDVRASVAAHRALVELAPDNVHAWLTLSQAYLLAQRPQRALSAAQRALEIAPEHADALMWKGLALLGARRVREGIAVLEQARQGKPSRPEWLAENLGAAYYKQTMYPEAIEVLRRGLEQSPEATTLKAMLGVALKDDLRFDEAMAIFEALRARDPNDPFPWRQIGFVHAYRAQPERAIPALQQSLQLAADQPQVWTALAEAYHVSGRLDEVKRIHARLRAIDPKTAERVYRAYLFPHDGAP